MADYIQSTLKAVNPMAGEKMKSTKNHKRTDGKFHSKHIKHDPSAESARAVFGLKDKTEEIQK